MECFEPINYDKRVYGSQVACLKASDTGMLIQSLELFVSKELN